MRTPAGYVILIVAGVQCLLLTSALALLGWRLDQAREGILGGEQEETRLLGNISRMETEMYRVAILSRDTLMLEGAAQTTATAALGQSLAGLRAALAPIRENLPERLLKPYRELKRDLEEYANRSEALAGWSEERRRREGTLYIARELVPRREELLHSTQKLADLVTAIHDEGRRGKLGELEALRGSVFQLVTIVILLGLALGGFAWTRIKIYEAERARHLDRLAKVEARLRQLSQHQLEVQEAERKRISRELHDSIGQMLTALRIRIGMIEAAGPGAKAQADEAIGMTEQALRSIRDLARGLRPTILDDLGLAPALRSMARDLSRGTGLDITVDAGDDPAGLNDAQRTCVYRIVQEALTNVVKHAAASQIRITLAGSGDEILVTVEDDGVGFAASDSEGIGILGMQERAAESGGTCVVSRHPRGRGTVVTTRLPRQALERTSV